MVSDKGIIFHPTVTYPDGIIEAFLNLLANVLEGQRGPHIDEIVTELTKESNSSFVNPTRRAFYKRALGYIPSAGTQGPAS